MNRVVTNFSPVALRSAMSSVPFPRNKPKQTPSCKYGDVVSSVSSSSGLLVGTVESLKYTEDVIVV